jgi:PAP2 superfamily
VTITSVNPRLVPAPDLQSFQPPFRRGLRELALVTAAYSIYTASRLMADGSLARGRDRATSLLDLERAMHLNVEASVNHAVSAHAWLAVPMSLWYASLHYLVTPAVLVWIYLRRPEAYSRARNVLAVATGLGLLGFLLAPTAPPRLMGTGYVDTLARYSDFGWWSTHASAPAGLGRFTNELAAMPSLHVGWAVWVAWALYPLVSKPWRLTAIAYAAGTSVVVVATGNHWVLDVLVGAVVLPVAAAAVAFGPRATPVAGLCQYPERLVLRETPGPAVLSLATSRGRAGVVVGQAEPPAVTPGRVTAFTASGLLVVTTDSRKR